MRQQVVTHHLEMTDPSQLVPARKSAPTFSLCQAEIPCPALNRFLHHIAIATAINLQRCMDWLWEVPRSKTSTSHFARLALAA